MDIEKGLEESTRNRAVQRKRVSTMKADRRPFQADGDGELLTRGPTLKKGNGKDVLQEGEDQMRRNPQKSGNKKTHTPRETQRANQS